LGGEEGTTEWDLAYLILKVDICALELGFHLYGVPAFNSLQKLLQKRVIQVITHM
jgi:hypothetical protein